MINTEQILVTFESRERYRKGSFTRKLFTRDELLATETEWGATARACLRSLDKFHENNERIACVTDAVDKSKTLLASPRIFVRYFDDAKRFA